MGRQPARPRIAAARRVCIVTVAVSDVTTTVTELPESRVRVEAEVPAAEVEKRLAQAARELGRNMRVPGFRTGKVPPPVDHPARRARGRARRGGPRLDRHLVLRRDRRGEDRADRRAGARPLRPARARGSRCGSRSRSACARRPRSATTGPRGRQARAGRRRGARSRPSSSSCASAREARDGRARRPQRGRLRRHGLRGLARRRAVRGRRGPRPADRARRRAADPRLRGAARRRERRRRAHDRRHLPRRLRRRPARRQRGRVRGLRQGDQGQGAARRSTTSSPIEAGFDTLDELREDIRERLAEQQERGRSRVPRGGARRGRANATVERARRARRGARARAVGPDAALARAPGISKEAYLQISGSSEDGDPRRGKPDAEPALEREAVLAAVVAAEGIEPSDEEVVEARRRAPRAAARRIARLLERDALERPPGRRQGGRRQRKAMDLLAESAKPITVEQAKARDKLWTPGQERPEGASELWTPGS